MNQDLLNILANSNKDIDNQKLMDYLNGKLSDEEKHDLEKTLVESDFMNDAVEGLEKMGDDQHKLQAYVEQLNQELQVYIQRKKARREKKRFKDNPFTYVYIILVLALAILSFVIIRMYLR